jgi:TPR repeat protein
MYHQGEGVPQDDAQSVHWYRLAAGKGDAFALNNLGFMAFNGLGMPADPVRAYALFTLAAQRKNSNAQRALDLLKPKLGNEEVVRGDALVTQWDAALKAGQTPAF